MPKTVEPTARNVVCFDLGAFDMLADTFEHEADASASAHARATSRHCAERLREVIDRVGARHGVDVRRMRLERRYPTPTLAKGMP